MIQFPIHSLTRPIVCSLAQSLPRLLQRLPLFTSSHPFFFFFFFSCLVLTYHSFVSWQSLSWHSLKRALFLSLWMLLWRPPPPALIAADERKVKRAGWHEKAVESLYIPVSWRTEGGWLHGEGLISEQLTDWRVVGVHEKGRPSVWLKLTYSKQKSPGFTWESLALRTLWHGPLRTCVYSSNTLTYRPSFSSFPLPASPLCVYHALHLPAVSAMPDWGCVYYHVHGPAHNQPHRISWSIWLGRTCVDVLLWLGAVGQACLSINQAWPLNARPVSESLTTSRRAINREISFSLYITNG